MTPSSDNVGRATGPGNHPENSPVHGISDAKRKKEKRNQNL